MILSSGERTFVSVFSKKKEFLPSMVAELGWAGSWEFVIFLDFRMVPDNLLLTVVFSVGDWSTVVSGPLPFIPSPIGVIVRAISRAPTQLANLFRSRVSVPRDFLLVHVPFLERWSGQKLIEVSSPFLLWPSLPLFFVCRRNWGRDENIIVWEDRWAWGSCYKETSGGTPSFPLSYVLLFFTRPPRAASCSHFESRCMLFGAAGDKNKCPIRGVLTVCSQTILRPSSKKTQIRGGRLNMKLWVIWIYWATCGFQFLGLP